MFTGAFSDLIDFLHQGGPAMWGIFALSIITVTLILWKTWTFVQLGVWRRAGLQRAIGFWQKDQHDAARNALKTGVRADFAKQTMDVSLDPDLSTETRKEEIERIARLHLIKAQSGLRVLELISTIAPLLGLLGTVLGMIAAFQALQEAGNRADPSALAGGIWEALLTTAAGMAVAIPASAALTWFESIIDQLRHDMEDTATRILIRSGKNDIRLAAE
ncbi:MotA/TolQ/ExbB proton channel family protein [Parasulfitobacter algicola]|uniref:MotA/TolQ/ExbB proton channel family protein n=1 Tax=Parasulfitobacter algicola TaxID=2614809 RepID=A0ABX2IX99_9RHOB|nr:MotA/TolQ/ExbB proton channel family protein [Sulfitobacter algicola]NSX54788.1 MotA/TolQ/ExbB proton channel family protein [Sulfitobacter algicola]